MAHFEVGDVIDGLKVVGLVSMDSENYYAIKIGTSAPSLYRVDEFDKQHYVPPELPSFNKDELADAELQIKGHLDNLKKELRAAQAIADKYGLSFEASLDLPPRPKGQKKDEDYYDNKVVTGEYQGKGHDPYGDGDEYRLENGRWYWQNSSLNC